MGNALQEAVEWLNRIREQHAATTVEVYNGETTIEVPATVDRTNFRTFDEAGNYIRYTERDFIIRADALVFAGVQRLPTRDWRIRLTTGLRHFTYQVSAPPGEQVFRYSDHAGVALRIHTKLLGVEDES